MLENQKKVIIVSDEERKIYANYLSQLIASNDDEDDKIIGCKDGMVEAVVWDNKTFLSNAPKLSSYMDIIFIGEDKSFKDCIENILIKFDDCGIKYGWIGNVASIKVDDKLLQAEYIKKFNDLCENLNNTFEKKIKGNTITRLPTWAKIAIGIVGTVATGGLATTAIGLGLGGYGLIAGSINKTEQIEQQYKIAVLKFYMDDLSNFLGENK